MSVTISLAQMDCLVGEPSVNFVRAESFVAEAARRGSDLVLLPELWSTAYDLARAPHLASPLADAYDAADPATNWFARAAALAHDYRIWVAGSMLEAHEGRYFNTLAVYAPEGSLAAVYRKTHLFRLMQEEQYLAPGPAAVTAELPWGRTGLAICYDLRFPELFRGYALAGARLMVIPAEWPHPRRSHWRTLLRARAIENQCFVAACNRVGESNGTQFFGASTVISPWGETLVEAGEVETLLTVTIDLNEADRARTRIPVFADRRTDLY